MARNGSGVYSLPESAFTYNTVIDQAAVNSNFSDIASALTASIAADGQTTVTASLPLNSNKLTGLAVGSAATDSASLGQVQAEAFIWCGTMTGSANAGVLTPSPAITAYAAGQRFVWMASSNVNTGAMTVAVSGLSTIAAQNDGSALAAGDHAASKMYMGVLNTTSTIQIMRIAQTVITSSSTTTFTNKTFDANGTGNSISNIDIADLANGTDGEIPTWDAAGAATTVAVGTSGHVLTSGGVGVAPTFQAVPDGVVKQIVSTQTGAVATGTTVSPDDDTIPQNTEGNEFMTLAITPSSTSNRLIIEVCALVAETTAGAHRRTMALFQDTTAGALAAVIAYSGDATSAHCEDPMTMRHIMAAGTTSATTFKVRIGGDQAGTITFNGRESGRMLGGVIPSSIMITEIEP
jgi:hypothetical protein